MMKVSCDAIASLQSTRASLRLQLQADSLERLLELTCYYRGFCVTLDMVIKEE